MSEPLLRALARMRAAILDDETLVRAVASGRQRGTQPAVATRRAQVRRSQGRSPPPGHGVRRRAGAHLEPRARRTGADGGRRPARPAVRQLARRHGDRDASAPSHQEARGRRAHARPAGRPGRADPRPRPRQGPAARRGRSGLPGARSQRPRGPDEAEPAEQVPPGRGVPPHPRRLDRRRPRQGPPAHADTGAAARDRRPRLRQRLPDVRHRALPHPRPRAPGAPHGHRPARAVARAQRSRSPAELGVDATFVASSIEGAEPPTPPDVVLALHACDTATDDALARAIEWATPLVLAAPCCHHDIAAQLRKSPTPAPYAMLTRHGILRERFADTLTDGLRASLLRLQGYRVDVMQFVGSEHTPRNTLLRAVRTGSAGLGWLRPPGVRRAGDDVGRPPAAGRAAGCLALSIGLLVAAPFAVGLAVTPDAPHGTTVFSLPGPGDRGGERTRRAGRPVPHHQRLR